MITIAERTVTIGVTGDPGEISALVDEFKFKHPHRSRILSYALYVRTTGERGWDGYVKPMKRISATEGQILRGYKPRLLQVVKDLGLEVNPDSRVLDSPFQHVTTDEIPPDLINHQFQPDEDQREIIVQWLKTGMGIGHLATNAGKTMAFAGFAAMLKRLEPKVRCLYVTDRERLTTQVYKEMTSMLPGWHITKFGGGGDDNGGNDMVVCTLAMLRRHRAALLAQGWFNTFHAVLFDEVHHASATTAEELMMEIRGAFFRCGASATLKADDPLKNDIITGLFGSVLHRVEQHQLIDVGRSAEPHIYLIDPQEAWAGRFEHIGYSPEPGSRAWVLLQGETVMRKGIYVGPVYARDEEGNIKVRKKKVLEEGGIVSRDVEVTMPGLHTIEIDKIEYEVDSSYCLLRRAVDECIVNFKDRNELIGEWAKYFSNQGKRTLIIATRTVHVMLLEAIMCGLVDPDLVVTMVGADASGKRDKIISWFKKTKGAVLISPLIQEGVSINEIEAGIVADYVADYERAKQIIGRFIRKKEVDNYAEIVWFIDRQQKRFEKGCLRLFDDLNSEKHHYYYWPLVHPEDLQTAVGYDTTAIIEEREDAVKLRGKK